MCDKVGTALLPILCSDFLTPQYKNANNANFVLAVPLEMN